MEPCSIQLLCVAPVVHISMYIVVGNNKQSIVVGLVPFSLSSRMRYDFCYHQPLRRRLPRSEAGLCLIVYAVAKKTLRSVILWQTCQVILVCWLL